MRSPDRQPEGVIHVDGTTEAEKWEDTKYLNWISKFDLCLGDELTLKICEADESDPPLKERLLYKEYDEEELKERWETARAFYEAHRDRFQG